MLCSLQDPGVLDDLEDSNDFIHAIDYVADTVESITKNQKVIYNRQNKVYYDPKPMKKRSQSQKWTCLRTILKIHIYIFIIMSLMVNR